VKHAVFTDFGQRKTYQGYRIHGGRLHELGIFQSKASRDLTTTIEYINIHVQRT